MSSPSHNNFSCTLDEVQGRIRQIDPLAYDKTRNYLDGAVTWLSPFISHGITNTQEIAELVLKAHEPKACYRLLYELGWREFFHRTWQVAGDDIFKDMKHPQPGALSQQIPTAILQANTTINCVDDAIRTLHSDGLMHNHARMWLAAITCNFGQTRWLEAARYLHYHLLDGDLASNTLSWQWIAGSFSHKQYVANQQNINKYSRTTQSGTWLDVPYEAFEHFATPKELEQRSDAQLITQPFGQPIESLAGTVALRSIWQLNPRWQTDIDTHIVFVDTQWLSSWPISANRVAFIEHWAAQCHATIVCGTVDQLNAASAQATLIREEYPACAQWPGQVVARNWLYPMPEKSFSSFSQYFKQVKHTVGL